MDIIYFVGKLSINNNIWVDKRIYAQDHNINCIIQSNKYPILFEKDESLSNVVDFKKVVIGKILIWEEYEGTLPNLNKTYPLVWSYENIPLGTIQFDEIE